MVPPQSLCASRNAIHTSPDQTYGEAWPPMDQGRAESRRTPFVMNNLQRFTVCKLAGHKWLRVAYPPGADGEDPETFSPRGQRCGKENHNAGTVPAPSASAGGEELWIRPRKPPGR